MNLTSKYEACLGTAQRLMQAGQLPSALQALESFTLAYPAHAEAWNDVGALQHALRELDAAANAARRAVELDSGNPTFRHNLATILFDAGQLAEAADVLQPLLKTHPEYVPGLILAGDILSALNRPQDARLFLSRALQVDPRSTEAAEKLLRAGHPNGWWTDHVGAGDLVFDVGANVGMKAADFLARGARVLAIEPLPQCLTELHRRFDGDERVTIVDRGLSDRPGRATIQVCDQTTTLSTLSGQWKTGRFAQYSWSSSVEIELTTLDELIRLHGLPRYCKVDVEGHEVPVLQGLSQPIPLLSFEYTIEFVADARRCLEQLTKLGYRRFNLSVGEESGFRLPGWASAEEVLGFIERADEPAIWGDVYALAD
jgi:FkbM family methyltransferase